MRTDSRVVLIVVLTLAVVTVGSLGSAVVLTALHIDTPSVLAHAFDLGIGAMATLLAKTSTPGEDLSALAAATPQRVTNEDDVPGDVAAQKTD